MFNEADTILAHPESQSNSSYLNLGHALKHAIEAVCEARLKFRLFCLNVSALLNYISKGQCEASLF